MEYVKSENNKADPFTRQSPGLEPSLNDVYFQRIWAKLGPFDWDLMATSANVNKTPEGSFCLTFQDILMLNLQLLMFTYKNWPG